MQQDLSFFLIDDDLDDQEIFVLAIEDIDTSIHCKTASDGCEALNILKENENFIPDYIFLDLNMPRVNGRECLVEMRKIPRLKSIPIYIYSTSSSEKDRIETLSLGATGFITKPNSIDELVRILSDITLNVNK